MSVEFVDRDRQLPMVSRNTIAKRYNDGLGRSNRIQVAHVMPGAVSTWAQYTIQVPNRERVQADLKVKGVPTMVYYPIPLTAQKGYSHYPSAGTPVSDRISKTVMSLPMHPYLEEAVQDRIIDAVLSSVEA